MAIRCLADWQEITELDYWLYGDGFTDLAVAFVAALRFQCIPDVLVLASAERSDSASFAIGAELDQAAVVLPEDQWAKSREAILAVLRLPNSGRCAVYGAAERMLHSKLCRQAGFLT